LQQSIVLIATLSRIAPYYCSGIQLLLTDCIGLRDSMSTSSNKPGLSGSNHRLKTNDIDSALLYTSITTAVPPGPSNAIG